MEQMVILDVTRSDLPQSHICCAIGDRKHVPGVEAKKAWLETRMKEGLTFRRADARGKAFIQYAPAETTWWPIEAPGYLFIECFWVSGSLAGGGIARRLVSSCLEDKRAKNGVAVLVTSKKRPFMNDKKFFAKTGFTVCDEIGSGYELMVYRNKPKSPAPRFVDTVRSLSIPRSKGFELRYSAACPFTALYAREVETHALERGLRFKTITYENAKAAREGPSPFPVWSLFMDGKLLTHEILNAARFDALLSKETAGA